MSVVGVMYVVAAMIMAFAIKRFGEGVAEKRRRKPFPPPWRGLDP